MCKFEALRWPEIMTVLFKIINICITKSVQNTISLFVFVSIRANLKFACRYHYKDLTALQDVYISMPCLEIYRTFNFSSSRSKLAIP